MKQLAGSLSGGEQAMLAVGRALMGSPQLLLVDEPSAGLSPKMIEELGVTLTAAKDAGTSLLLVEQNVGFGLSLADDVFVMEKGSVVYEGDAGELDRDRIASLLGMGELLHDSAPEADVAPAPAPRAKRTTSPKKPAATKTAPAKKSPATPAKRGAR
jgi:ABC-type multidrug transport system ATPase subunit